MSNLSQIGTGTRTRTGTHKAMHFKCIVSTNFTIPALSFLESKSTRLRMAIWAQNS